MAICCDIKECKEIIPEGVQVFKTQIIDKIYTFCKKCYEGLINFIRDNLLSGKVAAVPIKAPEYKWTNIPAPITSPPNLPSPYLPQQQYGIDYGQGITYGSSTDDLFGKYIAKSNFDFILQNVNK